MNLWPVNAKKGSRMLRVAVGVILALAVVFCAQASAAPRSFALWNARWQTIDDAAVNAAVMPCAKAFPSDDAKLGICMDASMKAALPRIARTWSGQVAIISRGQTPRCLSAIHAYWVATRKATSAKMIYLAGHPNVSATDMKSGLTGEPFATLQSLSGQAQRHAIAICG